MNPYEFLAPSILAMTSMFCMELAVMIVIIQWDPFEKYSIPYGRIILYWATMYIWCVWLASCARRLWGV